MGEGDERISLLRRLLLHALATAHHNVYFGEGRDRYDVRGRTAHECIFNVNDGSFRCPNSQQGYSPFSTWTRGLAWAILGFAEQLEFLDTLSTREIAEAGAIPATTSCPGTPASLPAGLSSRKPADAGRVAATRALF